MQAYASHSSKAPSALLSHSGRHIQAAHHGAPPSATPCACARARRGCMSGPCGRPLQAPHAAAEPRAPARAWPRIPRMRRHPGRQSRRPRAEQSDHVSGSSRPRVALVHPQPRERRLRVLLASHSRVLRHIAAHRENAPADSLLIAGADEGGNDDVPRHSKGRGGIQRSHRVGRQGGIPGIIAGKP